jgi:hypothetical protein
MTRKNSGDDEVIFEEEDDDKPADEGDVDETSGDDDDTFEVDEKKPLISRRNLILGSVLVVVPGIVVGPEAVQALKVRGVWKDINEIIRWIKEDLIPNKSKAVSNPNGFANTLKSKLADIDTLLNNLDALHKGGFRIRIDLAYEADSYIKEGIAFTRNDKLEAARDAIDAKHSDSSLDSGTVFVLEWLGNVNVDNYGSLIAVVDKIRARLMELRNKVVRLGDIDLWNPTNNYLVNTFGGIKVEEWDKKEALDMRNERIGRLRRYVELATLKDKLSKGDEGKDVERLQNLLVEFGYLSRSQVNGKYGGITESAVKRMEAVFEKVDTISTEYDEKHQSATEPDPQVQDFQRLIIYIGYLREGEDDGKYGEKTHNASSKMDEDYKSIILK